MNPNLSSQLIESRTARDTALRNGQGAAYVRHARVVRLLAVQIIGVGC